MKPRTPTSSIPTLISASPATSVATPHQSSPATRRGPEPTRDSGSRSPPSTARTAIGTLSRKTHRQLTVEASTPPTTGPSAVPTPPIPINAPVTRGRTSSGVAFVTSANAVGSTTAAPTPWTIRAATSTGTDETRPQTSEVSPNTAIPASSTARRPTTSPSRPPGMSSEPTAIM